MRNYLFYFPLAMGVTAGLQKATEIGIKNFEPIIASTPAANLQRNNFKQENITLAGGIAASLSSLLLRPKPDSLALGAGQLLVVLAGLSDDLLEPHLESKRKPGSKVAKGLKGHLGALKKGRITTGNLKILMVGAGSLGYALAAKRIRGSSVQELGLDAYNTAALANLINLFDLRPGRALKVSSLLLLGNLLLVRAGGDCSQATLLAKQVAWLEAGKIVALFPADLKAQSMLGDTGANILGANLGLLLALQASVPFKVLSALGATSLILLSEKISFSQVIDNHSVLKWLDQMGRVQVVDTKDQAKDE